MKKSEIVFWHTGTLHTRKVGILTTGVICEQHEDEETPDGSSGLSIEPILELNEVEAVMNYIVSQFPNGWMIKDDTVISIRNWGGPKGPTKIELQGV